jgi:hypothetical protein
MAYRKLETRVEDTPSNGIFGCFAKIFPTTTSYARADLLATSKTKQNMYLCLQQREGMP